MGTIPLDPEDRVLGDRGHTPYTTTAVGEAEEAVVVSSANEAIAVVREKEAGGVRGTVRNKGKKVSGMTFFARGGSNMENLLGPWVSSMLLKYPHGEVTVQKIR